MGLTLCELRGRMVSIEAIYDVFDSIDHTWIQRCRLLDSQTIFSDILDSALYRKGLSFLFQTQSKHYSPAALCKAKQKMPENAFQNANNMFIDKHVVSSRIFAIDGSKFYVPKSFKAYGFHTRTNEVEVCRKAKRPIAMLSSMVDVDNGICFDYCISKHFNERTSALHHLEKLSDGDVAIFDRGYFSASLYSQYSTKGVDTIFRLKSDHFKAVKMFSTSKHHDKVIN